MSDKRKVVIDCDPGIDDCFALMLCIRHLDVVGIVAVGGNTGLQYTERNARYMTELTGTAGHPGLRGLRHAHVQQAGAGDGGARQRRPGDGGPSRSRRSSWRSSTAWIIWWTRL